MPKFQKFRGVNNVLPSHRLKKDELQTATDVEIGLDGEIRRRQGYTQDSEVCHKNLFQLGTRLVSTRLSDLVIEDGGEAVTLYPSLGMGRVRYILFADGRLAFTNGLISGVTDGETTTAWGVQIPVSAGTATDVAGGLHAGTYRWAVTHVRESDAQEGGTCFAATPKQITAGGFMLTGLPTLSGHRTNVYLSTHDGERLYFAGQTAGSTFAFVDGEHALVSPCRTEFLSPAPEGLTMGALWRSRALVAAGSTLYASLPLLPELFDVRRDFKQFSANITLIQPVDSGVWVGTTTELAFLEGTEFDKLVYAKRLDAGVILGSGVSVAGKYIRPPEAESASNGVGMLCIAGGSIYAGLSTGELRPMTLGRYETSASEVAATFRINRGIPQYVAIPQ